jgi:hypothetical protein
LNRSEAVRIIYALAQRPEGVSSPEIAAATGIENSEVHGHIRWMCDSGRLRKRKVNEGRVRSRFYADPNVSIDVLAAKRAERVRLEHEARLARSNAALREPFKVKSASTAAVEWRVVDGRRVKVTVCPAGTDQRFTARPGDVAQVFGCLGPGRYLDRGETWASRAYGGAA